MRKYFSALFVAARKARVWARARIKRWRIRKHRHLRVCLLQIPRSIRRNQRKALLLKIRTEMTTTARLSSISHPTSPRREC